MNNVAIISIFLWGEEATDDIYVIHASYFITRHTTTC